MNVEIGRTRPPTPVVIAIVLLALAGVRIAVYGVVLAVRLDPIALVPLLFAGLWAWLIVGLRRRRAAAPAGVAAQPRLLRAPVTGRSGPGRARPGPVDVSAASRRR